MKSPSVYIIILNWNGLEDTLECLSSLENLTYSAARIIVIDNASKDNQAETIEQKFPEAIVLKQTENLGFCGGCNVGIKYAIAAGADFVMLLNNDTIVPPDLIEKLLAGFEKLENAGAVSPIILEYPETDKIWFSNAKWEAARGKFILSGEDEKYEDFAGREPYPAEFACGCCLLAPTAIFRREGLLDERYFAFYDEAEWCARIRRNGFESYIIPSAFMYHKISRSTSDLLSAYLMSRNRLLWMTENLPVSEKLKTIPVLLKEVVWHFGNLLGLTKKYFTKQHSRVVLKAWKDYMLGKFYKWDEKAEKMMFP